MSSENCPFSVEYLAASKLLALGKFPEHINLAAVDAPLSLLFSPTDRRWSHVLSADFSRLQIGDDFAEALAACTLTQLQWLCLCGNAQLGDIGVQAITKAVHEGRIPNLDWMDLLGTECDATPFMDGGYWRMTGKARSLAAVYGYQRWMMLGSRDPEMSSNELLSREESSQVPPLRQKLRRIGD